MPTNFDPIQYKMTSKENWNKVAPEYHANWADAKVGPFMSTRETVKESKIQQDDVVLDIACGTGAVSKEITKHLGKKGRVVGIDLSRTALAIAKNSIDKMNANFFEMDAENVGFNFKFDKITCQFGMMFFPDSQKFLTSVKNVLKKEGRIVITVHGKLDEVPYFSTIMNPILKHIPEIRPEGTPTVHRFGDIPILEKELSNAGFSDITIARHEFTYSPGTFEEYWSDYLRTTANSIRHKIEDHGSDVINKIKNEARANSVKFTIKNKIVFPWTVLVASGVK